MPRRDPKGQKKQRPTGHLTLERNRLWANTKRVLDGSYLNCAASAFLALRNVHVSSKSLQAMLNSCLMSFGSEANTREENRQTERVRSFAVIFFFLTYFLQAHSGTGVIFQSDAR